MISIVPKVFVVIGCCSLAAATNAQQHLTDPDLRVAMKSPVIPITAAFVQPERFAENYVQLAGVLSRGDLEKIWLYADEESAEKQVQGYGMELAISEHDLINGLSVDQETFGEYVVVVGRVAPTVGIFGTVWVIKDIKQILSQELPRPFPPGSIPPGLVAPSLVFELPQSTATIQFETAPQGEKGVVAQFNVDGKDAKLLWDHLAVKAERVNCPNQPGTDPVVFKVGRNIVCLKHVTLKYQCWFRLNAKEGAFDPPSLC
jgi:hypothetical protein